MLTPLSTAEEVKLLTVNTKRTNPKSPKPKAGPAEYSLSLRWFAAQFTPAKARTVRRTLDSFLCQHGQALGLMSDATWGREAV